MLIGLLERAEARSWIPRIAGFLVSPIFLLGILASYWIIIVSGWTLLMKRSLKFDLGISKIDKEDRQMLLIFSLLLCFFSVLTNMLTCCENNRMFMSFSPIALLIGGYVSSLLVRLFMETNFTETMNPNFLNSMNEREI